jgi:hypothetical protein
MRILLPIVSFLPLLLSACAIPRQNMKSSVAPPGLSAKLEELAGTSAISCGFAVSEQERQSGYACMRSAHASKKPFVFAYGPDVWFAWAGTQQGKVYQIFVAGDPQSAKEIVAVECAAFEVTPRSGAHCSIGKAP